MANYPHLKNSIRVNFYIDEATKNTLIKEARNRGVDSVSAYLRLHAKELRERPSRGDGIYDPKRTE